MVSTVHLGSRNVTKSRTVALPSAANPPAKAPIAFGFLPAGRLLTNSCALTFIVTRAVIRKSKYFFIFPITEKRAACLALFPPMARVSLQLSSLRREMISRGRMFGSACSLKMSCEGPWFLKRKGIRTTVVRCAARPEGAKGFSAFHRYGLQVAVWLEAKQRHSSELRKHRAGTQKRSVPPRNSLLPLVSFTKVTM